MGQKIIAEFRDAYLTLRNGKRSIRGIYYSIDKKNYCDGGDFALAGEIVAKIRKENGSWLIWIQGDLDTTHLYEVIPREGTEGRNLDTWLTT